VTLGETAHPHVVCCGTSVRLAHAGSDSRSCYFRGTSSLIARPVSHFLC
jgi:hypothetical protein